MLDRIFSLGLIALLLLGCAAQPVAVTEMKALARRRAKKAGGMCASACAGRKGKIPPGIATLDPIAPLERPLLDSIFMTMDE